VLLADHSKFEADHFARFGQVADLDMVITDDGLDEELAAGIAGAGPEVVRA
jgi:DeoR family fructose operon transcriptional repressor